MSNGNGSDCSDWKESVGDVKPHGTWEELLSEEQLKAVRYMEKCDRESRESTKEYIDDVRRCDFRDGTYPLVMSRDWNYIGQPFSDPMLAEYWINQLKAKYPTLKVDHEEFENSDGLNSKGAYFLQRLRIPGYAMKDLRAIQCDYHLNVYRYELGQLYDALSNEEHVRDPDGTYRELRKRVDMLKLIKEVKEVLSE